MCVHVYVSDSYRKNLMKDFDVRIVGTIMSDADVVFVNVDAGQRRRQQAKSGADAQQQTRVTISPGAPSQVALIRVALIGFKGGGKSS